MEARKPIKPIVFDIGGSAPKRESPLKRKRKVQYSNDYDDEETKETTVFHMQPEVLSIEYMREQLTIVSSELFLKYLLFI